MAVWLVEVGAISSAQGAEFLGYTPRAFSRRLKHNRDMEALIFYTSAKASSRGHSSQIVGDLKNEEQISPRENRPAFSLDWDNTVIILVEETEKERLFNF